MIQVDGEPAIKTLSEAAITSLNGDVKSRLTPSYSHQSLGALRSLPIIQSFLGWSSMWDSLTTDS
eukprot:2820591-Amphidinium_carterae.1